MENTNQFWERVFQLMAEEHGYGHPQTWSKPIARHFLDGFHEKLLLICQQDERKAKLCDAIGPKGEIQRPTIGYTTFYRITRQNGQGDRRSRELFAIYFGSDSYHAFLEDHALLPTASVTETSSKQKKRTLRSLVAALLLLIVILTGVLNFASPSSARACASEALESSQFVLVRTDDGVVFLDPAKEKRRVVAEGPHFTGFGYDAGDQLLFWSNTNYNYRTIGRASLSDGPIDYNLSHRFIKDLPYPLGIALDTIRNIIYLADYGSFDSLNDGSIRSYDYRGNLLNIIYKDSIDPSSIVIDQSNTTLYWTDPRKNRIGKTDLVSGISNANFLVGVGSNADGLTIDQIGQRILWASNKDSLLGYYLLEDTTYTPTLIKLDKAATALAFNPTNNQLLYSCYDSEKIYWGELVGDSLIHSDCGQNGLYTGGGSPGVVQIFDAISLVK